MTFGTSVDKLTLSEDMTVIKRGCVPNYVRASTRLKPPNPCPDGLGAQNVYLLTSQNFDLFAILPPLALVDHGEKGHNGMHV